MKTMIAAVLLSLGETFAFAQGPTALPAWPRSELQIGYERSTLKMRDVQASPMLYITNLNGVQVAYTRLTTRNQWRAGIHLGLGDLIAPSLGIRAVKFAPVQAQPLWIVPTLYRGQLKLEYRRLVGQAPNRTTWLGLGLHETVGYADGLVLSTWAFNSAAISLLYQTRLTLGSRHTLIVDATLPLLTAVSRMPYSNVVSKPNSSDAATFLGGTRWASINRFINPELGINYRFDLSRRVTFGAGYTYSWLYYAEPQLIRMANHTVNGSISYKFQYQRSY